MKQKIFLLISIFLILPNFVFGAPNISGVSGTVSGGQSVTISGSGFGATGPNVVFYDSFEKGSIGSNISTVSNSADIGNWNTLGGTEQTYSTENFLSGSKSMKVGWEASWGSGPKLDYSNVQNSDILISWWQYMPIDRDVPGTNNVDGPNWKWFWIGDQNDDWPWGSDYSIQCLSSTCDNSTSLGLLDDLGAPARYDGRWYTPLFSKGTWLRVTVAMRNATSGGFAWQQEINGSSNSVVDSATNVVTAHADDPWNVLTLPGFGREDNNAVAYYDDVYVAIGNSARARLEIGNASTYSSSTNLTLLTPTSWGDSSVSATVRQGSFNNGSTAYLYLIDASGEVNANGFPIVINSSDAIAPSAPSGLSVL